MTGKRPAIFFDRDGVINRSPAPEPYVLRPEDFFLMADFPDVLRRVTRRGYPAVVVTNQRGVSLGRMTSDDLRAIHVKMIRALEREGLSFLAIEVCTSGDPADPRRKPNSGMLLDAAARHALDLNRSWMIGDSERDIEAGSRAGCRTVRVCPWGTTTAADRTVSTLRELAALLESELPDLSSL